MALHPRTFTLVSGGGSDSRAIVAGVWGAGLTSVSKQPRASRGFLFYFFFFVDNTPPVA